MDKTILLVQNWPHSNREAANPIISTIDEGSTKTSLHRATKFNFFSWAKARFWNFQCSVYHSFHLVECVGVLLELKCNLCQGVIVQNGVGLEQRQQMRRPRCIHYSTKIELECHFAQSTMKNRNKTIEGRAVVYICSVAHLKPIGQLATALVTNCHIRFCMKLVRVFDNLKIHLEIKNYTRMNWKSSINCHGRY